MSYRGEFRAHWRHLLAASVGLGVGVALNYFTMSAFGPALIADLGWSKADFALVGSLPLATMLLMPFAGRVADSDIGAFLVSRRFDVKNFSMLLGFLNMMVGAGMVAGSMILSLTLRASGGCVPFLLLCGLATLAGAALFGLTGAVRVSPAPARAGPDPIAHR